MMMKDLGENAFLLQFMHKMDMERVIDGGPWNFMQNLIILAEVPFGHNPRNVPLYKAAFWVQPHDYPVGSRTERAFEGVGNYIGNYVQADSRNFSIVWRDYLRIRVLRDVNKPLKRKLQMKD